ncbi:unnamed protein product [Dicrocoelium dendriticum]|nr:unnamed protein product [Dicrocoelium dendriticum]
MLGLVALLQLATSVWSTDFTNCGSQIGSLVNLSVVPCNTDPCEVFKGERSFLYIQFTASTLIESGQVKGYRSVGGPWRSMPIRRTNLCRYTQPRCPIQPNGTVYTYTYIMRPLRNIPSPILNVPNDIAKCVSGSQIGSLVNLSVVPCNTDPCEVFKGERSFLYIQFTASTLIESGQVKGYRSVGGPWRSMPIRRTNLCRYTQPRCPIQPNGTVYTYTYIMRPLRNIPSMPLRMKWQLLSNNETMACAEIQIEIRNRPTY